MASVVLWISGSSLTVAPASSPKYPVDATSITLNALVTGSRRLSSSPVSPSTDGSLTGAPVVDDCTVSARERSSRTRSGSNATPHAWNNGCRSDDSLPSTSESGSTNTSKWPPSCTYRSIARKSAWVSPVGWITARTSASVRRRDASDVASSCWTSNNCCTCCSTAQGGVWLPSASLPPQIGRPL